MRSHWTREGERGNAFAIHLIFRLALLLGRRVTRLLLYPITLYFLVTARKQRQGSDRYLRRVLARPPRLHDKARHIHCFASTILDRVFLLAGRFDAFDIRIIGEQTLEERVAAGRGCLLLGSHLGSFEILRALALSRYGVPLKALMYRDHNPVITRLLESLDPSIAASVIDLGREDALLRVGEAVRQGHPIGLLGDRVGASNKAIRCHFLGAEATFPAGPMLIARALKVPVVLFFGLYLGGNRYEIHFEPLASSVAFERWGREAGVRLWTQRYVERLEHYTRKAPYNWFNFYDYWDEAPH
jgi:predicted LPLAT superfamily acyltransferase